MRYYDPLDFKLYSADLASVLRRPVEVIAAFPPFKVTVEKGRDLLGDINAGVVDSLKALDPERPIREADISRGVLAKGDDPSRMPYFCRPCL
jgi:hypothetical protein